MANEFFNGQFVVPTSGCGTSNLPGVAVYSPEVTCPGAGFGASTFASPATPLAIGLGVPIARFTFATSAGARRVLFGELSDMCLAILTAELGGTVVGVCDEGVAVLNRQAQQLCCWWDSNRAVVLGLVAKTDGTLSSLAATQVVFQPCNPCFTSDVDFVCAQGCNDNSNFILTNAVAGGPNGVVVNIPAGAAITFEVCTCAPQVDSFATCPTSYPSVARIAAAPSCPPYVGPGSVQNGYPAQNGYSNGQF